MEPYQSTTPFGRRTLRLAHVASQEDARGCPPEKTAHKWTVFRAVCAAKERVGVTERALAVLDALLSFHPDTTLTTGGLVVYPSNKQLALRAHGMAPATLRRHLAMLVDAGLVIRRDSPNGKRYARRGRGGDVEVAFGFDLVPMLVRAEEFEAWAAEVAAEQRALRMVRERITLCRRDIAKMIAMGLEEEVPLPGDGPGPSDWAGLHALYRAVIGRVPRSASRGELEPLADELTRIAEDILKRLQDHVKATKTSGNESQDERHEQNSNPDTLVELEPSLREGRGGRGAHPGTPSILPVAAYPLGMVLDACPDIVDYARGGVSSWRDFHAAVAIVRPMLGISPSAWEEARAVMGDGWSGIVVACILQRAPLINSAGGYLRSLTRRAQAGQFSLGPMLMALIGSRNRGKLRA